MIDIGTTLDQCLDLAQRATQARHVQGRDAERRGLVDVGLGLDQLRQELGHAVLRRNVQRPDVRVLEALVDVGAVEQQQLSDGSMRRVARNVQRRGAVVTRLVDDARVAHQQLGHIAVVELARDKEWCRAILREREIQMRGHPCERVLAITVHRSSR